MEEKQETKIVQIEQKKNKKMKTRTLVVLIISMLFLIGLLIVYRANYLEVAEIGENYIESFNQDVKYRIIIGILNFIVIYICTYITNIFIKKGLKVFFEEDKKEMPILPNKSIALIFAIIAAIVTPNLFLEKSILFFNNSQFGITDPVFNADIGFYMFQAPFIKLMLYYLLAIVITLSVYTIVYYIIAFNKWTNA